MGPQSSAAFLMNMAETFGFTPTETLNSDFVMLLSMIREYNFLSNERRKKFEKEDPGEEYVEIPDFETGKPKRVKKVKSL